MNLAAVRRARHRSGAGAHGPASAGRRRRTQGAPRSDLPGARRRVRGAAGATAPANDAARPRDRTGPVLDGHQAARGGRALVRAGDRAAVRHRPRPRPARWMNHGVPDLLGGRLRPIGGAVEAGRAELARGRRRRDGRRRLRSGVLARIALNHGPRRGEAAAARSARRHRGHRRREGRSSAMHVLGVALPDGRRARGRRAT